MDTIYVNNSGEHGDLVIFATSDRPALFAGLKEAFGSEFDPEGFDNLTHNIDLTHAMNHSEDSAGDDWAWLLVTWRNNRAAFMDGAAAAFEAIYARWQTLNNVTTPGEIAREYGIADATVRQAIDRGDIPARKSGGTWLLSWDDADDRWGNRRDMTEHPGYEPPGVVLGKRR